MSVVNVKWQISNEMSVEFEANGQKDLVETLASLSEVLSQKVCGACEGFSLKYQVRTVDGNTYYEIKCNNKGCGAVLSFGQHREGGTLFPKRKDKEGNYLDNNGWIIWEGNKDT